MTDYLEGQVSLFDQDTWFSKMSMDAEAATTVSTSRRSSRKSSESQSRMPLMCLCLKTDGQKQDTSTMKWEAGLWHGRSIMPSGGEHLNAEKGLLYLPTSTDLLPETLCLTLNIGELPREDLPSKYSDVIEDVADSKYLVSSKACQGILNRVEKKGSDIPQALRTVLEKQRDGNY